MNTLSIELAGAEWRNILQDAIMGIPSLITKAGRPVAEVKPLKTDRPKPVFGCARGQVVIHDDFDQPLDDFSEYKKY
jgi:antitoxin (DNA-binding transcriptional repressor) of toxin-antitoxin stability system